MKKTSRRGKPLLPSVRVGTDLIHVGTVQDSIERFGSRYLERVFTTAEIEYCQRSEADKVRRFAARFAAKEATLKVLRPDQHWLDWRTIEVIKASGGWCELKLHGPAKVLARRAAVTSLSVSLSHEDSYALAMVSATIG